MASSPPQGSKVLTSAGPASEPPPGALLKHAREQRGLTLAQLSSLTKIPQRHLEALESGNPTALSGDFYRRAHIRTYAGAVDLDPRIALASFDRAFKATTAATSTAIEAPRTVPSRTPTMSPRTRGWIAAGVVALAAVLGFVMRGTDPAPNGARRTPAANQATSAPIVGSAASDRAGLERQSSAPIAVGTSQTTPAVIASTPPIALPARPAAETGHEIASSVDPVKSIGDTTTSIAVATEPAAARVTVNGIGWGVTPVTIRHLPPGEKRIRVSLDGFQAVERVIDIGEGQHRSLVIRMRPIP